MATEQFANIAQSTLSGAIDGVATTLTVASATTFPSAAQFRLLIGSEILLVTAVAGTTFTVTRGAESTTAAVHANGATVTGVLTSGALSQFQADTVSQAGAAGSKVWVGNSSQLSSTYANGVTYIPMRHAQSDTISFQFVAGRTGTINLGVVYAMSSALASNVRLRLDVVKLATSDNPTNALTTGTAFIVAPGSNVVLHTVSSSDSADLAIPVTAGQTVACVLTRLGADVLDTHQGDMRVLEVRLY